jgi:inner membrane protein YidH
MNKIKNADLTLNETLTVEMTNLANERSLLAYMRTFVVFLSSGIAILKIELFKDLIIVAYLLLSLSPILLLVGIIRFFQVKKTIDKMRLTR